MSQMRAVEIPESAYAIIVRQAAQAGLSPATWLTRLVEGQGALVDASPPLTPEQILHRQEARERFRRHFGTWIMPPGYSLDNEQIDADIAREIANMHEDG